MNDLNDLALFALVVDHRGFSAASRHSGIPKSRLSRRIAQLEERLGVRLLQRNSRALSLTAVGQPFYERCKAVVAMAAAAHEVANETMAEPQGLLRVSCPITLAQAWLTPLLSAFLQRHPRVRLALAATNRRVDPLDGSIDVVLRVRRPPFDDSSLVVRPLGRTRDVLVASPALLSQRGEPARVQDLAAWPTLALPAAGERQAWRLQGEAGTEELVHEPRLVADDMFALQRAARDGLGVALLPQLICAPELSDGRLRRLLPGWASDTGEVQAVFPTRRGMPPVVRAFIDHLAAHPPMAPD